MIMDMSASIRLKALTRVFHTGEARAPEFYRLGPSAGRRSMKSRRFGSRSTTIYNALLIAALSLWVVGCAQVQPDTLARSTPSPPAATKIVPVVASAPQPRVASAKPTSPAPQPPQRISEPKPAPALASKGAERLAAPANPAIVRAREKLPVKAEPIQPKAPIVADSGAITDAPAGELIFKGPPPQTRTGLSAKTLLLWIGIGLGAGALVMGARLYLIRRSGPIKLADDKKDDLMPAEGLLFKEPVSLSPGARAADKS
jgi:hypothetical protein